MKLNAEEFVRLWQASKCLDDVAKKARLSKKTVTVRATSYRKRGIPLKNFKARGGRQPLDISALKKIAEDSLNG